MEEFSKKSYEVADELEFQSSKLNQISLMKSVHCKTARKMPISILDNVRSELQKLRGQQASLEALQQTALGQRDNPAATMGCTA